jgi:hypothetical protein
MQNTEELTVLEKKLKQFYFTIIIPIYLSVSEKTKKIFADNNCNDAILSIQNKQLNLTFLRKSPSYEIAVETAKKDVKNILESFGFQEIKMLVINYS